MAAGSLQDEYFFRICLKHTHFIFSRQGAASQLQDVLQTAKSATTAPLKACAMALVKPQYLKHKDKDVRLLTAFCCSECLRIYAPEPPYSDPDLKVCRIASYFFHKFLSPSVSPL